MKSDSSLRLLHLVHSLHKETGGTAAAVLDAARQQAAHGHRAEIAYLHRMNPEPDLGVPLHAIGDIPGGYGRNPHTVPWLRRHSVDYDAVIVHGLWQFHGHAARIGTNVPVFVFPHGMLDPWFNRQSRLKYAKKLPYWWFVERRNLRAAAAVCYTCEEERRLAQHSFPGYRARDVVVGLGIPDPLKTQPGDSAAETAALESILPGLAATPYLLFLGRIHPKKGLEHTLAAFAQLEAPPALVIAGPASDRNYAQSLCEHATALGLRQHDLTGQATSTATLKPPERGDIVWLPLIEGPLKEAALRHCEALVLSSFQENFGLVVAEALAVSRPILLSEGVNIWREVVTDGAGFAAPATVEGALQVFRQWLALSSDAREQMRNQARACFSTHFEITMANQRLLDTIRSHLAGSSSP